MSETNFIKQLQSDIKKYKKIQSNPKLFIKSRNARLYKLTKPANKLTEQDLPIQTLLGSVFLIKNDNILEFCSYCDYNHSMYLQITKKQPLWIGLVNIINLEHKDHENIKFLLDGCEKFYSPSNYQYFIIQFLHSGFQLYIK